MQYDPRDSLGTPTDRQTWLPAKRNKPFFKHTEIYYISNEIFKIINKSFRFPAAN